MNTEINIPALRAEIKTKFPDLQFRVKTVSFSDLARNSAVFIESKSWGMCKGNRELFNQVKAIADKYNVITSW